MNQVHPMKGSLISQGQVIISHPVNLKDESMGLIHKKKYHTSALNHEEVMQSTNLHETRCQDKSIPIQSLDAE